MAKLLIDDEWFEQIHPAALYEFEFEDVILQKAPLLFPDFIMVPFKTTVQSDYAAAKPDLALIAKNFRKWWVVEVEMANHSLAGHVLPQVEILSRGYYGEIHAENLRKSLPSYNNNRVKDMVKGKQPNVLVIVNASVPEWEEHLRRFDAKLSIIEIFRSDKNRRIFRVNGEYISAPSHIISKCHFLKPFPNMLSIDSPAGLNIEKREKVTIRYQKYSSVWERMDIENQVILFPIGANPLSANQRYQLLRGDDGILTIEILKADHERGLSR